MNRIDAFLELGVQQGGSDIHLVSGEPPRIRIHGNLEPIRFRDLSKGDVDRMLTELTGDRHQEALARDRAVDFAYSAEGLGRFRVNVYHHVRGLAAVFRVIPDAVKSLDEIQLPESVRSVGTQKAGLTLVTGPTGSGKSTSLAALIDFINENRKGHIITVEDPIEFVHQDKQCLVSQREIGTHAPDFSMALRNALREDPDVVLVGEMRDLETISLALTAAETGVQVFGTLHTAGASRTIDRIVNVFPTTKQEQVRSMLADGLRMIVSQTLVRNVDGTQRILAAEVMLNTPAIAAMIRSGKNQQIPTAIQTGAKLGMQSLDGQLKQLVNEGRVTPEEAYSHAIDKSQFSGRVARREVA